jgi:hypothetical protein
MNVVTGRTLKRLYHVLRLRPRSGAAELLAEAFGLVAQDGSRVHLRRSYGAAL